MKFLKTFTLAIGITYLIIIMAAFLLQEKLIFFPDNLPEDFQFNLGTNGEEVFLPTRDGETINGLYYSGPKPETILYFHGNAGSLEGWQYIAEDFTSLGYNLLIIDYRGYGKSTGTIAEDGLYEDAEAAFSFLTTDKQIAAEDILIYGRSIGTGIAVELAKRHQPKGLILEAPFTSLKQLANQKLPLLRPSLFLKFHFDNMNKIRDVRCPILFIHGSNDTLIPPSHAKKLFEGFNGKKKKFIIPGGSHNDLNTFQEYHTLLKEVLPVFFD